MRNILPSRPSEFLSKDYWNSFFSKLKSSKHDQYFEWYGSFLEHSSVLTPLIPKHSSVLNIGCGKSLFAEDLLKMRPDCEIISCDYSQQVIKQMQSHADKLQIKTKYQVADVFDMKYEPHSFDVVFDKGTLDAVFPEETQQNVDRLTKRYFPKILQIIKKKVGSKYIVISLLQQHILKLLLEFFSKHLEFTMTIFESRISDSKLQPFVVSVELTEQPRKDNTLILHLLQQPKPQLLLNPTNTTRLISSAQAQHRFNSEIPHLVAGQHHNLNAYDKHQSIRYNLDILDSPNPKLIEKNNCMVMIVPQGQERSFMYSTEKGLKMLREQVPCARLIVAKLVTGQMYEFGLEGVKQELNGLIPNLLPKNVRPQDVPYVTDSEGLGQREYVYRDNDYVVEEVKLDGQYVRRLIITANIGMVQSEYRLRYFNEKNEQKQYLHELNKLKLLPPKKKGMLIGIDEQYLEPEGYEQATIAGLELLDEQVIGKPKVTALVLGGGGCVLSKFLYNHYKNMDVTTIEIDGKIIELAERYFEVKQDNRFHLLKYDALKYVFQTATKGQTKYDIIIFDINGGTDGEPSPAPIFLTKQFLGRLSKLLSPGGLLIYHLIHRETPPVTFTLHFNPIYTWTSQIVTMVYCRNEPLVKKKDPKTGKDVIVTREEFEEVPKKGRLHFAEGILGKVKLWWPRVGGAFEETEVFYENEEGELVNTAKNLMKEEAQKVNKKKKKKR